MPKAYSGTAKQMGWRKAERYAQHEIWQNRTARLLFILLLCVHPLYFDIIGKLRDGVAGYLNLTRHKFIFFVVCTSVVLLIVFFIWVSRILVKPRLFLQDRLHLVDWAILGFAAVTLLSAILSPFRGETDVWRGFSERFDGAITQLLYIAVFFIISRWYKPRERDLAIFGISAILVALIGIFQFYDMDFLELWPYYMTEFSKRTGYNSYNIFFRSTLGNVNIVSSYVCIAILLCGFLFIKTKSKWWPLWLAGSALNFWLMELADADSGRIGLLATVVAAIPFIIESRKTLGKTFILASSWVAVYTLQKLLYDYRILDTGTARSLLMYGIAFLLLFAAGLLIVTLKMKRNTSRAPGSGYGSAAASGSGSGHGSAAASGSGSGHGSAAASGSGSGHGSAAAPDSGSGHGSAAAPDSGSGYGSPVRWKLGVLLIAVTVAVGIAGVEVLGRQDPEAGSTNIIYELREILHGDIRDEFATNRIYIWRNALRAFPNNPIIGSGPDTFKNAFPEEAQGAYGEIYENAHNEYVQILICQGIVGLICYLIFIATLILKAIPKSFGNPLLMAVLAAFTGYCVQAFFNLSIPIVTPMLWVFAGMLANKSVREMVWLEK